jgi:cellobiose phosphorylase
MGRAGINGKGVSVWLSIAFVRAAKMLSQMAKWLGRDEDSAEAAERAAVMEGRVNEFGWDGDRYIYAISDDRILIGAKENEEGSMFALPQLWSVFADFDKERALIAMETLERELNTDIGLLISAPAYTEFLSHVGTMCQKFPGLHENGGAYLHGAVWKLAVDSMLGRNDKVEEGLRKILPDDHTYYETCGEP